MKKVWVLLGGMILLIGGGTWLYQRLESKQVPPTTEESQATKVTSVPDFDLLKLKGGSEKFSDHLGKKPIVLNFWASTCPPCVAEMPMIEAAYQKYRQDIDFITINYLDFNGETRLRAKSFVEENNYEIPVFFDTEYQAINQLQINSIPQTYFLNEQGEIVEVKKGQLSESTLEESIQALLD